MPYIDAVLFRCTFRLPPLIYWPDSPASNILLSRFSIPWKWSEHSSTAMQEILAQSSALACHLPNPVKVKIGTDTFCHPLYVSRHHLSLTPGLLNSYIPSSCQIFFPCWCGQEQGIQHAAYAQRGVLPLVLGTPSTVILESRLPPSLLTVFSSTFPTTDKSCSALAQHANIVFTAYKTSRCSQTCHFHFSTLPSLLRDYADIRY